MPAGVRTGGAAAPVEGDVSALRILVAHNAYQHRGGEDAVVEDELALLQSRGHVVKTYLRHNDDVSRQGRLKTAAQAVWSRATYGEVSGILRDFRPDVIHVHNTLPLISPSIYWAADRLRIPVVQTLHNFRMSCLNGLFLRDGRVCEDCLGHLPWRGVTRACYRESTTASATLAGMLAMHRALATYRTKVTRYIALNEFCRRKFIEAGLPADRVVVKPNFVDFDPPAAAQRGGMLFVGRLSREKGVATLAKAMAVSRQGVLRVAGDGPEGVLLDMPNVVRLGALPGTAVRNEMERATALIVASICYENFPRTIAEAFACGLPVIASRIGALADIVQDGKTGLLFEPGNARDLADKVGWASAHPLEMEALGRNARAQYELEFSADVNYRRLMEIYAEAMSIGAREA